MSFRADLVMHFTPGGELMCLSHKQLTLNIPLVPPEDVVACGQTESHPHSGTCCTKAKIEQLCKLF